jgi:hypothetical protein
MDDYAVFEAPPPSMLYHIIWNILLADKQFPLTLESLCENKIGHIVAFLPSKNDFEKIAGKDIQATVIEYGDKHEPFINTKQYEETCSFIDNLARNSKDDSERNVLVFCNNGHQRSIPFLVYYLTRFHSDECPSISKAIDLIIPQVDKLNYLSLREKTIKDVTKILTSEYS